MRFDNSRNDSPKKKNFGKPSSGFLSHKFSGGAHGIARVISKRGYCSRSKAEMLVQEGRVSLNGRIVRNPDTPTRENDEIVINGQRIEAKAKVYFMMNKPRGIVTTASDEKGRKTVMEVFTEQYRKLFSGKEPPHVSPVGRLDAASEGLLLFSNDTEWANEILEGRSSQGNDSTHGSNLQKLHKKIYRVQTKGKPTDDDLKKMEEGFVVPPRVFGESDEFMHAKRAVLYSEGERNCWLEITLTEGKNREIRRMLAHLGYEVLRLVRIQIDDFILGELKPGCIKEILP